MLITPDVRFGPKADMCSAKRHVRFVPIADTHELQPSLAIDVDCGVSAVSLCSLASSNQASAILSNSAFSSSQVACFAEPKLSLHSNDIVQLCCAWHRRHDLSGGTGFVAKMLTGPISCQLDLNPTLLSRTALLTIAAPKLLCSSGVPIRQRC